MHETDSDSPKASFDRATTFLRAGDAVLAERICRQALNAHPRDVNLLCLLGATLIKQEKASDAENTLSRAARIAADFSRAHEGLAEALIMQGKLPEALHSLKRAAELEPGSSSIRMKKAQVLTALGRDDEATNEFEESFKLTPHRAELVRGLGLQRMGNIKEAEKIYRDVLLKDPANVDALRLLAGVAMRAKQWGDAEALLEKALDIAPDFFQGWMDLGLARQEQDKMESALEAFKRVTQLEPNKPNGFAAAGTTSAMAGWHEDSISWFEEAIEKDPGHPGALSGLGHVFKTVGRQEDAIDSYRRCVRHNPDHGESWWSLANLQTFRFDDEDVAIMEQQLELPDLHDEMRANFEFALGKAYEDRKDYDRAFMHYEAGNANRRQRENYDPVQTVDVHDQFINTFTSEFLASKSSAGDDSNAPILIVGLPRSGSTLIEQILASHPQVEGTHELPDLGRVARMIGTQRDDQKSYPSVISHLDDHEFAELGRDYLQRTTKYRLEGLPRFTDKLPNNFVHVGFLHLILPNAKIINARRHPLDSCLGSFKQLFARGQPFTYDQFELGEFYMQYQQLMDHWHAVLPGKVLDVQYENVVDDLETEVRRILEYCDLPWDDACLRFWETDRAVKTASSEQVRKPIYASSKHLWRNYESHLQPLIEVLEPLLAELPLEWRPDSTGR
ncbi:MAG: sulfotransferase [Gammaproteobacteria bacterium]|nr:sulfotransferase [Gammaproteobacteria bacterium]